MNARGQFADITFLLEGTYPFVRGGVSGWVHQLIEGLPQYTFSLVFLGARKGDYDDPKYSLPNNVVHLESHYLWDPISLSKPKICPGNSGYFDDVMKLHDWFRDPAVDCGEQLIKRILVFLEKTPGCTAEEFFYSEASWRTICNRHSRYAGEESFVDYFWTVRAMHAPLLKLARIAHDLQATGVLHSPSTGYAGFLGALAHHIMGRPFILTEHGIYTKERKIDLQSLYIREHRDWFGDPPDMGMAYHKHLWFRYFGSLGRLIYRCSNPIISLYENNRQRQIKDGVDPARTRVIPNGMDVERFLSIRARRPRDVPQVIGLVGRIVPIKDIKTFIRAMLAVSHREPEVEGWLIGPEDEDKDYVEECKNMAKNLGLETRVRFLGFQKIGDILPRIGLLVMTSISEAFPLVILEAYASGVPVVATDVGACREIIEGNGPEDRALGSAGAVVPIADPEAIADAAVSLLTDEDRWYAAQQAGIKRLERHYTESNVLALYTELYDKAIAS